jgi:hypothetical protein
MLCLVIPDFGPDQKLPPGVHWATWEELTIRYGTSSWRRKLLRNLKVALLNLKQAGCFTAYLDGSFITGKERPGDFDGCWDTRGVDPTKLDPLFIDLRDLMDGRRKQKLKYLGELVPATAVEGRSGMTYLEFFQTDKATGDRKGIIAIDLRGLQQ